MMSKARFFLFVLGLILSFSCSPARGESLKKEDCSKTLSLNYQDSIKAFEKIKEGMGQQEVCKLLGAPDRISGKDPDQTWYDELWTYDFRKLAGYPKADNLRATWEGDVMFLNRKVGHTRKIGWLE